MCGQGFTYCGYILRDHQNFNEQDIVKAYCAGNQDNCANGKTKTDPIQALYVCLPPQGQTSPKVKENLKQRRQLASGGGGGGASGVSSGVEPMSTFWTSTGNPGGNGVGGGNSCSSTETPGNRIELLYSCGNQCLNLPEDHIGRCDVPCS